MSAKIRNRMHRNMRTEKRKLHDLVWPRVLLCSALIGLLGLSGSAHAGKLYRYTNAQGAIEIASSIPNHLVVNGYQVIDSSSGRVLRTVAPQLTPEQVALKAARQKHIAQCRDAQRRVNSLYQHAEDIDLAERQALESIETRILNAQASLTQLRIQQRDLEDQAARFERSGHGVTAQLMSNIEKARAQIQTLEVEVLGRRAEQDEARLQFDRDREVLRQGDCVQIAEETITSESLAAESRSR